MKQVLWTQDYMASTFLVNSQKRLGLFGVLNLLQDAAWVHAEHLGVGFEEMLRDQTIWALVRQTLVMNQWPEWGKKVHLHTWSRGFRGPFAVREFEIFLDGVKCGECSSAWVVLDLNTRKPKAPKFSEGEKMHRDDGHLSLHTGKIEPLNGLKSLASFQVRGSDLDLNGHVNNTRYAQWILDSTKLESKASPVLTSYEVNFLAESGLGDQITIQASEEGKSTQHFQGLRESDQKIVFTARLS